MITIVDKNKCSGCQACFNACPQGCITMNINAEGFWYPETDKKSCIDCSVCGEVCPIIANIRENESVPKNRVKAFEKSIEISEKISEGIFYIEDRPTYEDQIIQMQKEPLVKHDINNINMKKFYEKFK